MHVKVGDTVKVISGRDKGQVGEITKIFKHNSTVIVQDINLKTKHRKSRDEGELGQITQVIIISLARKNIIMNSSTLSVR
jgi:large subunit ribosomal protein L24